MICTTNLLFFDSLKKKILFAVCCSDFHYLFNILEFPKHTRQVTAKSKQDPQKNNYIISTSTDYIKQRI